MLTKQKGLREGMEPEAVELALEAGAWRREMTWEEEPVLTISLRWPKLPEDTPGLRRVGRYYRQVSEQWKARWERELYRRACDAAASARAASRPFQPWTASLDFCPTYQDAEQISLYQDAVETCGGTRASTVRRGDAWELPAGIPRTLSSFFPPHFPWRRKVLEAVAVQTQARLRSGESVFYEDWPRRLEAEFHPDRFYLTTEGLCLFYPLCSIAPYVEGIPAFLIPLPAQTT